MPIQAPNSCYERLHIAALIFAFLSCQARAEMLVLGPPSKAQDPETSIIRAAEALDTLLKRDGSFVYEARLDGRPVKQQYNLVRHAGAIYALNMFERRWLSPAVKWDIESGLGFLKQNVRALSEPDSRMAALLASPDNGENTVLGATALGIVAFLTTGSRRQSGEERELISGMGRFLLSMQKTDGAFFSRYNFQQGLRDDSFSSLYYPGEAALALVFLHTWDASPDRGIWGDAARRALLYLADLRASSREYPPDNWALSATRALFEAGIPISDADRAKLVAHAERIVETDLVFQEEGDSDPVLSGALTETGSPTQTSTRLEGVLAALTFITDPELIKQAAASVRKAVAFLLRSQIGEGSLQGAFPETVIVDRVKGRHLFVRIDYIQHALAALILYRDSGLVLNAPPR